ncbi:MAG: hypothetical protein ACOVNY_04810 [Chitinophagaceae bacterium]
MPKVLTSILLLICVFLQAKAQLVFEDGYFINDKDEKISCLIKNTDWANNPTKFRYKLQNSNEEKLAVIDTVKEFGIINGVMYKRYTVSSDLNYYGTTYNDNSNETLKYTPNTIFLKVLVQGATNLLEYTSSSVVVFFISKNLQQVPVQLAYKNYIQDGIYKTNKHFKKQLKEYLSCNLITDEEINDLTYNKNKFIKIVTKSNACSEKFEFQKQSSSTKLTMNVKLKFGLTNASATLKNGAVNRSTYKFDNQTTFRLGAEYEVFLPANINKWSLFIDPAYHYFSGKETVSNTGFFKASIEHQSIEMPIGIRYHHYLKNQDRIFVNFTTSINFNLSGKVKEYSGSSSYFESRTGNQLDFGIGVGYAHKSRASLELRFIPSRDLVSKLISWEIDYKPISLIAGFTLF